MSIFRPGVRWVRGSRFEACVGRTGSQDGWPLFSWKVLGSHGVHVSLLEVAE